MQSDPSIGWLCEHCGALSVGVFKNLIDTTLLPGKNATDSVAWLFPAFFFSDSHQALQ